MSTHNIFCREIKKNICLDTPPTLGNVYLFELEFYGPVNTVKVLSSQSVNQLILFFLCRHKSLKLLTTSIYAHIFAITW